MAHAAVAILLSLTICLARSAGAQRLPFVTYSMNEGLVQNAVKNIFQDSKGFIWFGTWEGVSRFDGNKFTNYNLSNGLSRGLVNQVFETGNGSICIVSNNGNLDTLQNDKGPAPLHKGNIVFNRLQKLPGGKIIGLTDHQGLYEFREGKFYKPPQASPFSSYYMIASFNDSLLIATGDSAVQLLDRNYALFAEWREPQTVFTESGLLTDSKKRVWIGTVKGLRLLSSFQEKGRPLRFLPLPKAFDIPVLKKEWIRDILEDGSGNTWLGTGRGLVKIGTGGSAELITEKEGLPTNDVSCVFEDREKNIWVGGSRGVSRLVTKTKISFYSGANGLPPGYINQLLPFDNGDLLVETESQLLRYIRAKNEFIPAAKNKTYYSGDEQNSKLTLQTEKNLGEGFLVFSPQKSNPVYFSPSGSGAYAAWKDSAGVYFYPTRNGIFSSRDFNHWKNTLFPLPAFAVLLDKKGRIWVGSEDSGLYRIRYEYGLDTIRKVQQQQYLAGIGIRSLYEDSKGYIWAGTRYHGVYRLPPDATDSSHLLHIDQARGLTSNRITSIAEDKNGSIWLNFYHGLDKLVPDKDGYRVFNFSRINNFFTNIQSMVLYKDWSIWLATTQGLFSISDGGFEHTRALNVYITAAYLGDSVYQGDAGRKIHLSYHHKQVQFEFSAPGFINAKQVLFSYRLLGSNNSGWSGPANEHSVSYASLQPGDYRFEVRTRGWNGAWGEAAVFDFTIAPPFWQTWWFMGACGLVLGGITFWLVRRRIKHIRHEANLRHRMAEAEMAALRSQMNPHFIFNCLNAIDNLIQTHQKDKATAYLARFAKLIRNVLDSSKNNAVPFQKDHESLQLYLQMEQFRCSDRFEYGISVDNELLQGDYKVPPLILQPFVENAIHHGLLNKENNDRLLQVTAALKEGFIEYTVTDNGIGRQKAALLKGINKPEHISYGIQITEERIRLYNQPGKANGDLEISDLYENGLPAGTRVTIRVKITDNN